MLSFFPLDVLDEIWDLFESVSEGFLTYSSTPTDKATIGSESNCAFNHASVMLNPIASSIQPQLKHPSGSTGTLLCFMFCLDTFVFNLLR